MSFEDFKNEVLGFIAEAGYGNPKFLQDEGKHIARCGDVTITGNSASRKLMVMWGHGHKASITV